MECERVGGCVECVCLIIIARRAFAQASRALTLVSPFIVFNRLRKAVKLFPTINCFLRTGNTKSQQTKASGDKVCLAFAAFVINNNKQYLVKVII